MQTKKTLLAIAVTAALSCSAAQADEAMGSHVYQGWGPTANLDAPYSPNESAAPAFDEEMEQRALHAAEVEAARASVWSANAHLRAPYETNATELAQPGLRFEPLRGFTRFFSFQRSAQTD